MPVIDAFTHVVASDRERYPLAPFGEGPADGLAGKPASTEGLLGEMQSCDVDRALLVQYYGAYGYDNAYVVNSVREHPGTIAGICVIDPLAADAAATLTDLVTNRGIRGLRMFQTPTEPEVPWLHDPAGLAVWDCARELGIPVMIARTPTAADAHPDRHPPRLRWLFGEYRDVPVALNHLAVIGVPAEGPTLPAELLSLADLPNVFCQLSTINLYRAERAGVPYDEFFGPLFEHFGAHRVMWGSNYPVGIEGGYGNAVGFARQALAFLSSDEQDWVFGRTALRLWPELA